MKPTTGGLVTESVKYIKAHKGHRPQLFLVAGDINIIIPYLVDGNIQLGIVVAFGNNVLSLPGLQVSLGGLENGIVLKLPIVTQKH